MSVFYKEQGTIKETPWHHDQAYYPLNGRQASIYTFTIFISLCSEVVTIQPKKARPIIAYQYFHEIKDC